ncbi:hypothetical protein NDU88_004299 [Pleurodeles waltl]|uniref:Uncharacterized protein n=1 Tax=Pleurodeles waltl TaxID=8319 RepID=A0AAV7QC74_PLEWA|nr:hypothetical protein NDU88_004299 [Pleurodeles waltl]
MPRPGRSKAGEGRVRRRTRVLEEWDETQRGAVRLEKTKGEQKEEAMEGGRHTEQSVFVERRPRGRVADEEASHVPGGAWLIQVDSLPSQALLLTGPTAAPPQHLAAPKHLTAPCWQMYLNPETEFLPETALLLTPRPFIAPPLDSLK